MNTFSETAHQTNTALAREKAAQMALNTGRSFGDCWNSVRQSEPHLFGMASREETDVNTALAERPLLKNRATKPGEIYGLVMNFQREHKIATFSEAHSRLREERPELFFEAA
jgi:hypothetical protein